MKKRIWLLAILVGLVGCAAMPTNLKSPSISLVNMRVLKADLFEQQLEVRLRVLNPNDVELPVDGLDVDVELADEPFAKGVSAREFSVPAGGEAQFDMIVTANAATALLKIAKADRKSREEIGYRLTGKLATRLGMFRSIPIDESGTVAIGDLFAKRRKGD